jgi:RNA recognition motif-containing protein
LKTLFIGNLPFAATQAEIAELFGRFGTVHSVNLIFHRESGRPRGFGFIDMDDQAAEDALASLNGTDFGGRTLKVEARHRDVRTG